jgi:hypothetical protein
MDDISNRFAAPPGKEPKNYVVLGIFHSRNDLERGVTTLQNNGFRNADVSALMPSPEAVRDLVHQAGTKAPEGATMGMAAGAVVGGTLGWLVGVGSLTIPGLGPLLAAGPLVSALAGIGAGSALGGLTGGLVGLGIPEYEAKRYEDQTRDGGILLTVHCDDEEWCRRAEHILAQCGASDISSTHEAQHRIESSYVPPSLFHRRREAALESLVKTLVTARASTLPVQPSPIHPEHPSASN